ncbi:glycosyl transferase, family 9 [Pseudogulbenkiania sp. NH8B]|uniref:glycosyltransferase family 9 protein n=1 Tax=Pseudogulbenkiania sp. (strain NH8B) TaxID=748280 RepID=UPI000227A822|nr:glycosyltransferase family 9 protein [Pseudogulbenkiania sp. NH8B]BAK78446.1 glycosyl transferase, family 9 [Pseudogulbenkiania sp. NH8B]
MLFLLLTWFASPLLALRLLLTRKREPAHILLIQTAKIGDMICTTPLFSAIQKRFPSARLTVLADPVTAPLIEADPNINQVWRYPARAFKGFAGRWRLFRLLTREQVDTTICVSPNQAFLLVPFWAGVSRRLSILPNLGGGLSYRLAAPLLSHGECHLAGRSVLETEWHLLKHLGIPATGRKIIHVRNESRLKAHTLLPAKKQAWAGLGISSGNKLKALSVGQLKELAETLLQKGYQVVLVGAKEDSPISAELIAVLPKGAAIDAAGLFALADLPAMIEMLDFYVGVDSGITYLADAFNVPLVDFMGPADADDQSPDGRQAIVVRSPEPCAPCSHAFDAPYFCKVGTRACVLGIAGLDQLPEVALQRKTKSE